MSIKRASFGNAHVSSAGDPKHTEVRAVTLAVTLAGEYSGVHPR